MNIPWKLDVKVCYDFCMAMFVRVCIYLKLLFCAALGGVLSVNFSKVLQVFF